MRRRQLLLLWSAVPVLVLLGVAAKFLSLGLLAGQAAEAYAAKDTAAVEAAAEGLNPANVVERHKAPFAAGDAKVLAGDYPAARILFEEALDGVPAVSPDDCVIRVNLSLAIEHIGDAKLRRRTRRRLLPFTQKPWMWWWLRRRDAFPGPVPRTQGNS
ncbi:hypothetical protein [Arthrobacter sp. SD76]|uniref:hypothetical protein n=1 Tax=Arthrobacter sp. SD76 TaxID=3415007 RepID=UPI003C79638B